MGHDLRVTREAICAERLRLLLQANAEIKRHCQLVRILRGVAGEGRPVTFAFAMGQATEAAGHVKAAFEAYSDHLELHGCGGGQVAATCQLPVSWAVRVASAMQ